MNIHPSDFVLEIGSGHNPKTRSDILCDKYLDDDTQRGGHIVTDRPIVEADGEYLPFADGSFDYVICSHVLEHVQSPERLISELTRVASRGYIETPSEIAERLYGWPYHNWMINLIDGKLIIQKKAIKGQFGQLFHALAAHDKYFARFHTTHHSLFLVQYEWAGKIDYEILPPDASRLDLESKNTVDTLLNRARQTPSWDRWLSVFKSAVPKPLIYRTKAVLARKRKRPKKTLRDIIVCPMCKRAVEWHNANRIRCNHCEVTYPVTNGIPRLRQKQL